MKSELIMYEAPLLENMTKYLWCYYDMGYPFNNIVYSNIFFSFLVSTYSLILTVNIVLLIEVFGFFFFQIVCLFVCWRNIINRI